jgi:hypothetical protein
MKNRSPDWHLTRSMSGYRFGALNNGADAGTWKLASSPLRYLSQVGRFEFQRRRYGPVSPPVQPVAWSTIIPEDLSAIYCMDRRGSSFSDRVHGGRAKEGKKEQANAECKNHS